MRPYGKNMQNLVVRVSESHRKALDEYANELSSESGETISVSDLVRKAIKEFLKQAGRLPKKVKF